MCNWWLVIFFLIYLNVVMSGPSVIIIGAGPAGIAAATKLLENSVTNITVLEAEDRIGGRINSLKFGDEIVDLGAQYCHGMEGNIAYELAKNYSILEPGLRGLQTNIYYSNGSKLDVSFIQELMEFYLNYHKFDNDDEFNITQRSLGEVFIHKYLSLHKKYSNNDNKIKLVQEGLEFLKGFILIHEGSFSWFHPSAQQDYTQCEGLQNLMWKGLGYKGVLQIMTKEYPDPQNKLPIDDKIHLEEPVKKIIWKSNTTVEVVTSTKTYSADHVIFTASVGVLKRNRDTMFHPQLPDSKKEAIEATGLEGVMKVFLYFPIKWWNDDDDSFGFFWEEEDLENLKGELSWTSQIRHILKYPHNTNVWLGWISGDLVPKIEKLPLETFQSGWEYLLNKFLGKEYNVTKIGKILRSNWVTNENFGGTYSFVKNGFYKKGYSCQAVLAKPLRGAGEKPLVLFAGEATNPIHYSTVHGAIESGYREAERILKYQNIT